MPPRLRPCSVVSNPRSGRWSVSGSLGRSGTSSTRWTSCKRSGRASSPARGTTSRRFADVGQFRGFLAGVARNKVYEEHRRQTRTKKYDLGREERLYVRKGDRDVPREVAASDPTPSETVQAGDRLGQLIQGRTAEEAQDHRPPPPGLDVRGDRRAARNQRAVGSAGDRRGPRTDGGPRMALKPRSRRGRPNSQRNWSGPRPSPASDPRRSSPSTSRRIGPSARSANPSPS